MKKVKLKKILKKSIIKVFLIFVLVLSWLFSGFPPIWQNPRIPPEIKKALAAEVTIDATVNTSAASHNGGSPTTVFISTTTGYAFYRDLGGGIAYRKTTDGGATWSAAVAVTAQTDTFQVAVWYDRWTPGDSTGNLIHIVYIETSDDDIFYRALDTSNDTFTAAEVNITGGFGYVGTLAAGTNHVALTKGTDGALYANVADASDNMMVRCTTTCTNAANWAVSEPASWAVGNDYMLLVPMLSGRIMFIWWDISATTNDLEYSVWNGTSWSAFAAITTALDNTTYDASFGAAVDPSTGDVYLAYANQASTLGTNDYVMVKRYNGTSWVNLTDVVTNSVCAGVSNCGITGVKISRDNSTGYLYVLYTARSDPATAATANLYWKYSTDNGSTWSSEFGPVYSIDQDIYGGRLSLVPGTTTLIYATWYEINLDDLFGRPIAPKTYNQSAYRLFNNLDSTDVGTPLAAQDTAVTLGSAGAAFRLRMLLHIGQADLFTNEGSFKLQFAQRGADNLCDTSFSGETYADVTAATVIAYKDNPTPADGAALTANANDPTHGGDTIINQTYEELNNFTNSQGVINVGQDGKWDFSLIDNNATANTAYCLRVVKSDGTSLDTYSVIPQITTATPQPVLTQNDFELWVDNDALTPSDIWGNPDISENAALLAIPPSNDPIDPNDEIRIRMNISVTTTELPSNGEGFILQFAEANDCTAVSSWTDVSAAGTGSVWEFADSGVSDGTTLTTLLVSTSDVAGRYSKSDPTSTNPNAVSAGQDFEWDWHLEYVGAAEAHTYCFRMVRDDSTALDNYNADSYPKIETRPGTANLMRHGNFFTTGIERGFFWAN